MQQVNIETLKRIQQIELLTLIEFDRVCKNNKLRYSLSGGTLLGAIRHKGFIPWDDDIDVVMPREDYEKFSAIANNELSDKYFFQTHSTDVNFYRLYGKIRVNGTVFKEKAQSNCNIHHGVFIDVFPIDNIPKTFFLRLLQFVRYKFFDSILSSKVVNNPNRSKVKRTIARLFSILFFFFSPNYLYKKLDNICNKYSMKDGLPTRVFSGAYSKKEVFEYGLYNDYIEAPFCGYSFKIIKDYDIFLKKIYGDYMKLPPKEKRVSHHDFVELFLGD